MAQTRKLGRKRSRGGSWPWSRVKVHPKIKGGKRKSRRRNLRKNKKGGNVLKFTRKLVKKVNAMRPKRLGKFTPMAMTAATTKRLYKKARKLTKRIKRKGKKGRKGRKSRKNIKRRR